MHGGQRGLSIAGHVVAIRLQGNPEAPVVYAYLQISIVKPHFTDLRIGMRTEGDETHSYALGILNNARVFTYVLFDHQCTAFVHVLHSFHDFLQRLVFAAGGQTGRSALLRNHQYWGCH